MEVKPKRAPKNPKKSRTPKCPICNQDLPYDLRSPNPPSYFPFCSERCKLVDLDKWLSEEYYISSPIQPPEDNDKPSSRR